MNVVLANDTSGTTNPGCQGTVAMLLQRIDSAGGDVVSKLPVGYGYDFFTACFRNDSVDSTRSRLRRVLRFPEGSDPKQGQDPDTGRYLFDEKVFEASVDRLSDHLGPLWRNVDRLIVNAEGTIHHDGLGALALVGLCAVAKRNDIPVSLVNGSLFSLGETIFDRLVESVDEFATREPLSYRYLRERGVDVTEAADCLFLANQASRLSPAVKARTEGWGRFAIYSPGVLSATAEIEEKTVSEDVRALVERFETVAFHVVGPEDEALANIAVESGAELLRLGELSWREVTPLYEKADLVVSGRYHLLIFAALAGASILPLATNTGKIDGLLELMFPDSKPPVRNWRETGETRQLDLSRADRADEAAVARCRNLAGQVLAANSVL